MKSVYLKIISQCIWGKNSIKAELITPKDRADRNLSCLGTVSALSFGKFDLSGDIIQVLPKCGNITILNYNIVIILQYYN